MIPRVAKRSADDPQTRRVVLATAQPGRGIPEIGLSGAARELEDRPDRRVPRWIIRVLVGSGLAGFFVLVGLALLGLADFSMAANGSSDNRARLQWAWGYGDHLHYAVHILQARVLDVCPCTRRAADAQYYRAHFHAVTPHQKAVASNTHPNNPSAFVAYVVGPAQVVLDWLGDGISWVRGNRPPRAVLVGLDKFSVTPPEIHVLRGTNVIWRNVDELGEAHTITADPGQLTKFDSDFLEPDEQFGFTFTDRGRYLYYCRVHGLPESQGMSGVVVVE
jgi:plastocyanin